MEQRKRVVEWGPAPQASQAKAGGSRLRQRQRATRTAMIDIRQLLAAWIAKSKPLACSATQQTPGESREGAAEGTPVCVNHGTLPRLTARHRLLILRDILLSRKLRPIAFARPAGRNAMLSDLTARLGEIRTDWNLDEVEALFALPFNDLLFHAQRVHRQYFDPNSVQVSTLLSIKTGACPEDCAYCPQSVRFDTAVETERLMEVEDVLEQARLAKAAGATRFCMGAAYRSTKAKQLATIEEMVRGVADLGLETCATLGMLNDEQ